MVSKHATFDSCMGPLAFFLVSTEKESRECFPSSVGKAGLNHKQKEYLQYMYYLRCFGTKSTVYMPHLVRLCNKWFKELQPWNLVEAFERFFFSLSLLHGEFLPSKLATH